ncbi:hypothetical protein EDB80DRAFT_900130 [Ilyonectria destructans]|nr:hypothetical protein EDB80DRAFT_900130 [Ilyonectria destructans]
MSLPTLRPAQVQQPPLTDLSTPPPTSPAYAPHKDDPPGGWPAAATPIRGYNDALLAQETAEDRRLQARADPMWRESQEYSCAEDNETTPWLKHTRWPELFRNRPLDIITASARQPTRGPNRDNEDYLLGAWRRVPLRSPAAAEGGIS